MANTGACVAGEWSGQAIDAAERTPGAMIECVSGWLEGRLALPKKDGDESRCERLPDGFPAARLAS